MWNEATATESLEPAVPAPTASPIAEDELGEIVDRLYATKECSRQNREPQEDLSRQDAETRSLQSRNAELEEIMRKFAPTLLNVATAMALAAKHEKSDLRRQP